MKNILKIIVAFIITTNALAQSTQKFSYQSVVRNASNNLVVNTVIGMKISILQGNSTGNPVYIETQNPTTSVNGLVSLVVGNGTVVMGTLDNIYSIAGPYFIKTEIDITGGANYTLTGTSQILQAPFALYATKASSGFNSFPEINTLDCASVVLTGNLDPEVPASGISFTIAYTSGNGDMYSAEVVNSTGVTGLTATRSAGFLTSGNSTVKYTISGTPNTPGTANFSITLGGKACAISIPVAFEIGKPYQGGIIGHLDGTGQHGLVVSLNNLIRGSDLILPWTTVAFQGISVPGVGALSLNDGLSNTNAIVLQAGVGTTYAAGICSAFLGGGFTDWYLPAKTELNYIYSNKSVIEAGLLLNGGTTFTNNFYLSSTEDSYLENWAQNFLNGNVVIGSKSNAGFIRAVHLF